MGQQVNVYRSLNLHSDAAIDAMPIGSYQGTYIASTAKNYALGARRVLKDGRVFRYALAGATYALRPTYGVCTEGMTAAESTTAAADASSGASSVSCTAVGTVTADCLQGGYLAVTSGTNKYPFYQIKSNTVAASTYTVTLEDPLWDDITTSDTVTNFPSPYYKVLSIRQQVIDTQDWPGSQYFTGWVGVPACTVAAGSYGWIQTWGPCILSGQDNYGASQYERKFEFYQDGSVVLATSTSIQPVAGYLMPTTYYGASGHDLPGANMLVMLAISP